MIHQSVAQAAVFGKDGVTARSRLAVQALAHASRLTADPSC